MRRTAEVGEPRELCVIAVDDVRRCDPDVDDERQERYEAPLVERDTFEAAPGQDAMIAKAVR